MPTVDEERTGDIAHLEARLQYFAFYSLCQYLFSPFVRFAAASHPQVHQQPLAPQFTCSDSREQLPPSPPQVILLVPEDGRALFPAKTTCFLRCHAFSFGGSSILPQPSAHSANCKEASRRAGSAAINPLSYPASRLQQPAGLGAPQRAEGSR